MSNLIGQTLGRYRILEQLGEGGMAVVYKAMDTRLGREVAIKVILPGRDHTEKFLKRFEREARALAQLSHPNIVKVLDYGEHEGLPFLVMEYIPGGNLKQRLTGLVPYQEAAQLLAPVARALAYAHSQKIIHRDVKPANILLTRSGDAMLSDFGIAKLLDIEETTELTSTGIGLGTPAYMAPEQGLGQAVDHRADIYALGVVFYELITGRKPYSADTPMAVLHKQLTEPLVRPSKIVSGLPNGVEQVLLKALAREPAQRYQSMPEFASALETIGQGQKVKNPAPFEKEKDGQTPSPTPPSRPWVWIAGAAVGLLGICVVSAVVFGILYFKNGNKPTPTSVVSVNPSSGVSTAIPTLPQVSQSNPTAQSSPTSTPVVTNNAPILLAYVLGSAFESENADVEVANSDGKGPTCVACNPCSESEPSISQDGEKVVYQSTCSGYPDLYIVSTNGSGSYDLTNTPTLSEREPAFSPDGSQIAYRVSAVNVDRNSNGEIYVLNSDGSGSHSLRFWGRGPVWSQDGRKLAYMSNESGTWQIYVYAFDTGNSQKITSCSVNCRWPAWSPDGQYIAYNTTPSASSTDPDSVWYTHTDGSGSPILVASGAGRPSWSASGWIAMNTVNGIEEIRQDGSQRTILVPDGSNVWAPAWSR